MAAAAAAAGTLAGGNLPKADAVMESAIAAALAGMAEQTHLTVLCGTANIGNASFDTLADWLPPKGALPMGDGMTYDIIAVGMQEATFATTADEKEKIAAMRRIEDEETDAIMRGEQLAPGASDVKLAGVPDGARGGTPEPPGSGGGGDGGDSSPSAPSGTGSSLKVSSGARSGPSSPGSGPGGRSSPGLSLLHPLKTNLSHLKHDTCSDIVYQTVLSHLGPEYRRVKKIKQGQMRLLIYAHQRVTVPENSIMKSEVNTGLGAGRVRYNNKGGQVVKLNVLKGEAGRQSCTSICFVSSHLAAHEGGEYLKRRNHSVREIMEQAEVGREQFDLGSNVDYAFWMGDMNYRINMKMVEAGLDGDWKQEWARVVALVNELDSADEAVRSEAFSLLWRGDELMKGADGLTDPAQSRVTLAGKMLYGWHTLKPSFKPTFKVHRQPELEYITKRVPSWCDRVLWTTQPGFADRIDVIEYDTTTAFATSDHKPVRCGFSIRGTTHPSCIPEKDRRAEEVDDTMLMAFTQLKGYEIVRDKAKVLDIPDPYLKFYFSEEGYLCKHKVVKKEKNVFKKALSSVKHLAVRKKETPRTTYKNDDPNPDWADELIFAKLHLPLEMPVQAFDECHILISCMDNNLGESDRIGSAAVSMGEVWASYTAGTPHVFDLVITNNGIPTGRIGGVIHLHHPKIAGDASLAHLVEKGQQSNSK